MRIFINSGFQRKALKSSFQWHFMTFFSKWLPTAARRLSGKIPFNDNKCYRVN